MFRIVPRNFNSIVDHNRIITNHNPIDPDVPNTFSNDGIFSKSIFGEMSNINDWSCNCGELQGQFNNGVICPECNTKVMDRGQLVDYEGFIDLVYPLIHPLLYRYIASVIGNTTLDNILNYKSQIIVEGHLIEPPLEAPFAGIGILKFCENFEMILDYFYKKNGKKKKKHYFFIKENEEMLFINYMPVINSKLRPAIVIDGTYNFDAINTPYNSIIANCNLLKNLTNAEKIDLNILPLCYKNQEHINEIYIHITKNITNKEGYIRSNLFGNRLDLTSRSVITPLTGDYEIDECVIPYITAIELFKAQIIRKISIIKQISLVKASQIWAEALLEFNLFVYNICMDIIKGGNVSILINRNPTIAFGSIMLLRIAEIKIDIYDLTTSIHNGILGPLGADYDGDVLNFILLFSKKFNKLFEKFRPQYIMIDPDSGEFNSAFLPTKDTMLGLESLFK